MKVWAEMHQLTSACGAFININREQPGNVGVWGMRENSILVLTDNQWELISFENKEYLDEWIENYQKEYKQVIRLETM